MLTILYYFLVATGSIAWLLILWSLGPHTWQATVFTARQWKAERPKLRRWYRMVPVWFEHWTSPCDRMSRMSAPGVRGYTIYWPGKEPKEIEDAE